MAVRLRLTRMGAKKKPHYRVVAQDSLRARDGRFIEILGHYNARDYPASLVLKEEKIIDWLKKGAKPTPAVKKLLTKKGLLARA